MPIVEYSSIPEMETAIYTVLTTGSGWTASWGPYNPAPENMPFPYVTFGEHIELPFYSFGKPGKMVSFVIAIWSQQAGFAEALSILNVISNSLGGQKLTLVNFTNAGIILEQTIKLNEPDGITRHVASHWRTWNAAL